MIAMSGTFNVLHRESNFLAGSRSRQQELSQSALGAASGTASDSLRMAT